jgi:hypothetical protein
MALTGLGRFDECLDPPKRALRVGPRDSLAGAWNVLIANCHFMRAEYPQAAEYARIAWQASPRLPYPPLTLAAAPRYVEGRQRMIDSLRAVGMR